MAKLSFRGSLRREVVATGSEVLTIPLVLHDESPSGDTVSVTVLLGDNNLAAANAQYLPPIVAIPQVALLEPVLSGATDAGRVENASVPWFSAFPKEFESRADREIIVTIDARLLTKVTDVATLVVTSKDGATAAVVFDVSSIGASRTTMALVGVSLAFVLAGLTWILLVALT